VNHRTRHLATALLGLSLLASSPDALSDEWSDPPAPAAETADAFPDPAAPVNVELELSLLVDASASMDNAEYTLQMEGYAAAFRDSQVQDAALGIGGIAVRYVTWSDDDHQMTFGWMQLTSINDCKRFADRIEAMGRPFSSGTVMASAIHETLYSIEHNNYVSTRQVIDVSGDGADSNFSFRDKFFTRFQTLDGATDAQRRDFYDDTAEFWTVDRSTFVSDIGTLGTDAIFKRHFGLPWADVVAKRPTTMVINGISIGSDPEMQAWYAREMPQGDGAFVMHADDFGSFGYSIKQKLIREITELPVPTSYD